MKRPVNLPDSPSPQQPGVKGCISSYQEKLQVWNPLSKKGLALFYQIETGPGERVLQVIPDSCVDLVFHFGEHNGAMMRGPVQFQTATVLRPNTTYFYFKPYSLTSAKSLKIPFSDLSDTSVPFEMQFEDLSIIERMYSAASFDERIALMLDYARKYLVNRDYKPGLVEHLELASCQARGSLKVEQITSNFGYTDRYCRGKFKEVHGISIKNYSDVMRFQNIVRMLSIPDNKMSSDVVFENQLYDQSHLIHEFKKYTAFTPCEFKRAFCPA